MYTLRAYLEYSEKKIIRNSYLKNEVFKVDDYLRKSSLTGPETFMVVFSHEKEEDSVRK